MKIAILIGVWILASNAVVYWGSWAFAKWKLRRQRRERGRWERWHREGYEQPGPTPTVLRFRDDGQMH